MFDIKTSVSSSLVGSVSILITSLCVGMLLSCSGDVSGPDFNVSASGSESGNSGFTVEETFQADFPVDDHILIKLEAISGEVVVTGQANATKVLVNAYLSVVSDSLEDAEMHMDDLQILVTDSANEILIQTVQPKNADGRKYLVEYDIIVPSSFEVMITQVNGSIDILNIENTVDVANMNGEILLSSIVGGATAYVDNGSIEAGVLLPPNETIDLSTNNGNLELSIPTSTSAEFSATVVNGEISVSNLDITGVVETNESLTGTIGDGEGSIALSTVNGDIEVIGFD